MSVWDPFNPSEDLRVPDFCYFLSIVYSSQMLGFIIEEVDLQNNNLVFLLYILFQNQAIY